MNTSWRLVLLVLSLVCKENYIKAPDSRIPQNPNFTALLGDTTDPQLGGSVEVSKEPTSCFNYFWHNILFQALLIEIKQLPRLDRDNREFIFQPSLI
jgi:hypothetical protein